MINLTEMQKSALAEAANIGSGHAAIALSNLLNKKIMIAIPSIEVVALDAFAQTMDAACEYLLSHTKINGDFDGHISLLIKGEYAKQLISMMPDFNKGGHSELNAYDLSVIAEVGNIVSAAYLNSLSDLAGLKFSISTPNIFRGNVSTIVLSLKTFSKNMDEAICIRTEFMQLDAKIEGYMVFSPSHDSVQTLLSSLHA